MIDKSKLKEMALAFEAAMRAEHPLFPLRRQELRDGDSDIVYVSAGTNHAWKGYRLATTTSTEPTSRGAAQGRIPCDNGAFPTADVVVPTSGVVCESLGSLLLTQAERAVLAASPAPSAKQEPECSATQYLVNVSKDVLLALRNCDREPLAVLLEGAVSWIVKSTASPAAPVAGSQQVPDAWMRPGTEECTSAASKKRMEQAGFGVWDKVAALYTRPLYFAAAAPAVPVPVEQRWIGVEDRLPKGRCIATYQGANGKWRTIITKYVERFTVEVNEEDSYYEINPANDTAYLMPGWYECIENWGDFSSVFVNDGKVAFWRELDAAPSLQQPKEGDQPDERPEDPDRADEHLFFHPNDN